VSFVSAAARRYTKSDAIVETHGRKSDLAELHPDRLARPEGFEPNPQIRSSLQSTTAYTDKE